MSTSEILKEISLLSTPDKLLILEKTQEMLRESESEKLSIAAEELANEYKTNSELTVFSIL